MTSAPSPLFTPVQLIGTSTLSCTQPPSAEKEGEGRVRPLLSCNMAGSVERAGGEFRCQQSACGARPAVCRRGVCVLPSFRNQEVQSQLHRSVGWARRVLLRDITWSACIPTGESGWWREEGVFQISFGGKRRQRKTVCDAKTTSLAPQELAHEQWVGPAYRRLPGV